ncbi:MAG: ribosome silencing factor [Acidobacteria bacterium]|nr:ribosome silencing factor [Acidobacteriota bacterium]
MTDTQTTSRPRETPLSDLVEQIVEAAREKKAEKLVVLDLRPAKAFTDYFVICSGRSDRQVKSITEHIEARLKQTGHRPAHIEGTGTNWVLIDCFDCIIHVFTPAARDFYALERLWGSAEPVEI